MNELYEIVIYTASIMKYAVPLIKQLDSSGLAAHHLFRNHCSVIANTLVKDLSLLGRDMSKIIIIDNSPSSYMLQPDNAIPIKTWTGDQSDKALMELVPVLEELSKVSDVREHIHKLYRHPKSPSLHTNSPGKQLQAKHCRSESLHLAARSPNVVQQIRPRFIPLSIRLNRGSIIFPRKIYENESILLTCKKDIPTGDVKGGGRLVAFIDGKPASCESAEAAAAVAQQHFLEYRFATSVPKSHKKIDGSGSFKLGCFTPAAREERAAKSGSVTARVCTASKGDAKQNLLMRRSVRSPVYLTASKNRDEKSRYELALAYDRF